MSADLASRLELSAMLPSSGDHAGERTTGDLICCARRTFRTSLQELRSEHILPYYATIVDTSGVAYICTESCGLANVNAFLSDASARERLGYGKGYPSLPVLLSLCAQLAAALAHVHARDVVHADIKLDNVFVTRTLKALLGDFGAAGVLGTATGWLQV